MDEQAWSEQKLKQEPAESWLEDAPADAKPRSTEVESSSGSATLDVDSPLPVAPIELAPATEPASAKDSESVEEHVPVRQSEAVTEPVSEAEPLSETKPVPVACNDDSTSTSIKSEPVEEKAEEITADGGKAFSKAEFLKRMLTIFSLRHILVDIAVLRIAIFVSAFACFNRLCR